MKFKALVTLSLLIFVFLLGFSFSVQAYAIRQKELNSPVSQYLRENYGVNSIEEYEAKLEQEAWLNYSQQMEALASEYPELNFSMWKNADIYRQAGTSTYQPPTLKSEQPFYTVVLGEPVVALQVFSLSGLSLLGLTAVPPVKRHKQLKQAVILGVVVLCIFSVGYFVGLTVAQTGTITIEPGSFQTEASYTVFIDGTTIKARNGTTGAIDYSGTDAAWVIQSAINSLSNGGKIFIKRGTYLISQTLTNIEGIFIEGEGFGTGGTTLQLNADVNMFNVPGQASGAKYTTIANINLEGNAKNGSAIYGYSASWIPSLLHLDTVRINNFGASNVYLYGVAGVFFRNCRIYNSGAHGVYMNSSDNTMVQCYVANSGGNNIWVPGADNEFIDVHVWAGGQTDINNPYGIRVNGERNLFIGCQSEHNTRIGILIEGQNNVVAGCNFWGNGDASHTNGRGIVLNNALYNTIVGNTIKGGVTPSYQQYCILEQGTCDYNVILGNIVRDATIQNISIVGAHTILKSNSGYVTENSGTVYPANNGTVITHGLAATPNLITLTLSGSRNFATGCYLLDPTVIATSSTTFTIELLYHNVTANAYYAVTPSVYNATIYWTAKYGS
jgi:hypothetical protein